MDTRRTLVIIRHAKAEAFAPEDHARVLTPSGEADAHRLGTELAAVGIHPDVVLISDAARTRGTWAAVQAGAEQGGGSWAPDEVFSRALYASDADALLELIREVPAAAATVMVIGHNPTVATLSLLLDDGDGDPVASHAMVGGHPTAAYAVFTVVGEWSVLGYGGARLERFAVARAD